MKTARPVRAKTTRGRNRAGALPSRDELLAYIGGEATPDGRKPPVRITKREIARAFGVHGADKADLKLLIKDLEADGAIKRGRKTLQRQGRLPALTLADIFERDRDGELIAKPVEWSEDGEAPRILVRRVSRQTRRRPRAGPWRARVAARRIRRRSRATRPRL